MGSWLSCEEHMEFLLDDWVERWELAPDIELISSSTTSCEWEGCNHPVRYRLAIREREET